MHADGLAAFRRHTTRPRPDFESLRLRPLTPAIGAELEAVDLSCPLPPVLAAELRRALDEYHVLVVRGQTLDDDAHKRVGRVFGELHVPPPELRGPGDFERLRLVTNADSRFVPGEGWHVDISCEEKPPFGSLLYMEKLPLDWGGGDTLFANMHLAYELLSPPMKEMLAHLSAVHDGNLPFLETAYDGRPPGDSSPRACTRRCHCIRVPAALCST